MDPRLIRDIEIAKQERDVVSSAIGIASAERSKAFNIYVEKDKTLATLTKIFKRRCEIIEALEAIVLLHDPAYEVSE